MTAAVHCPYCNSVFPAPPGAQVGLRVSCPRCGDGFAVRSLEPSPGTNGVTLTPAPVLALPSVVSAEREPVAAWRPGPAAAIEALDATLLTALTNGLLFIDGRSRPVFQIVSLVVWVLACGAAWPRRSDRFQDALAAPGEGVRPLRGAVLAVRQALASLSLLVPYLVAYGLFGYVLLTLGEGSLTLKAVLVLGGLALAAAVRLALSLANLDQPQRLALIGGGLGVLGLGLAWLASRWLGGVADHRYYLAYLAVCTVALVVAGHVAAALLRIRDQARFRVAGSVVGMMAVMSLAATGLALNTVEQRRINDAGITNKRTKRPRQGDPIEPVQPVSVVAPAKLEGLRYLPSDTIVVASVRVAELLDQPGGRERLRQPLQVGPLSVPVHQLETWTGLRPDEIDHVVFGVRAGQDDLIPRFVTIVRTRGPHNAETVRKKLDAREHPAGRKQGVYHFRIDARPPFTDGLLRSPDAQTLLIDWQQSDLGWITGQPSGDLSNLKPEIRQVLQERLRPHGSLWLAGHSADWSKAFRALAFLKLEKPEQELLTGLRTFVVWMPSDGKDTWLAAVRAADVKAATQARDYLEGRLANASRKVTLVAEEDWVTVQVRPAAPK